MLSNLSPEARFLLAAVGSKQELTEELLNLIKPNFEWDYLLNLAFTNAVLPLLYRTVSRLPSQTLPQHLADKLRFRADRISARNVILTRELINTLLLFDANGIKAIPYKGPVLAERLYGHVGLRQFDDLDILIHKADVLNAKQLLLENGYCPKKDLSNLSSAQEKAFLRFHYSYDFVSKTSGYQLEIHWEIVPQTFSLTLDYNAIWKRTVASNFFDLKIPTFAPEDLFLMVSIGGARHIWDRLSRICDIAQISIGHPEIQWEEIENRAKKAGAHRILLLSLFLASTLLEAPLPENFQAKIGRDRAIPRLAADIIERLFSMEVIQTTVIQEADQFQPLHVRMRERLLDKSRYCLFVTLTPSVGDWAVLSLPGPLYFFYYLLRPVRLFWKSLSRIRHYIFAKTALYSAVPSKRRKFVSLSWRERRLFLLALVMLPFTALGLRCFGLKSWKSLLARFARTRKTVTDEGFVQAHLTAKMVRAAVYHGIYRPSCLPQSVVLWWLLRRQGIKSELCIGMQEKNGELKGHAWVEYQGLVLNDQEDVRLRYTSLPEMKRF